MKICIKKSVGVFLILIILLSTLTGCYRNGEYSNGDKRIPLAPNLVTPEYIAKVESDISIYDKGDIELTLYYGLYPLDIHYTIEGAQKYHLHNENGVVIKDNSAIYVSNSEELAFECDDNGNIIDYENKVNAMLWKYISYEEAFIVDYGFTTQSAKFIYNHSEKITIPAEFFAERSGTVFIHVVCLRENVNDQSFELGYYRTVIAIPYRLVGNKVVLR